MNKGRQVARGNLNTLKLLSQGVYDVVMTFDHMPNGIEKEVERFSPLRVSLDHNTLEMTVKEREGRVLDVITTLARNRNVVRVELNSASLEDIFIELTKKEQVA